ncbi:GcrA family cell cycle regulator [Martelella mangrovi]|uniref:GcrA cell cycle regulator n=1 Tax=Martelella mangrovi TaxID=1397477 RepID=A0ABV2IGT9_9HYPH
MTGKPWTEDDIARMAALYVDGLSYAEIADVMGCGRSAVAGIANRHRDRFRKRNADDQYMTRRMANEAERQRRAQEKAAQRAVREAERVAQERKRAAELAEAEKAKALAKVSADRKPGDFAALAIPGARPVAMHALGRNDCRLVLTDRDDPPVANPPCCGLPVKAGKPYCAAHCMLMYRTAEERAA